MQQKGRPIPIHLQQSVEKEINKPMKQGHIEKANNRRKLFCKSGSNNRNKGQIGKNRPRFEKTKRNHHQEKGTNA